MSTAGRLARVDPQAQTVPTRRHRREPDAHDPAVHDPWGPQGAELVPADSGQPLGADVRRTAERAYGADLSEVRVHTGSEAERLAHDLRARAFTVGSQVVLGADGSRSLLHELAHVVQQRLGGPPPGRSESSGGHEKAARVAARAAYRGATGISVGAGTGVGVARSTDEEAEDQEAEQEPEPEVAPAGKPPRTYVGAGHGGGVRAGYRRAQVPEVVTSQRRTPKPDLAAPLSQQDLTMIAEAENAQERLGRPMVKKTKSAAVEGPVQRSGFGKRAGGGVKAGGGNASTKQVMDVAQEIGHSFEVNSSKDGGIPGREKASHAEKLAAVNNPNAPLAVDNWMCDDCRAFYRKLAQKRGTTLVVQEPGGTWVFRPDGIQLRRTPDTEYVVHPDGRVSAGPASRATGGPAPNAGTKQGGDPPEEKPAEKQGTDAGSTPPAAKPPPTPRVQLTPDQQIRRSLDRELRQARADAAATNQALDDLDKAELEVGLTEQQRVQRAALETRSETLEKSITGAVADLRLLTEPGASDASLNELRARRGFGVTVAATTDQRSSGLRLTDRGIESKQEKERTQVDQGTARTVTDTRTRTVSSSSYTDQRTVSSRVVSGAQTTTSSVSTSRSLGVTEGNITATSSRSKKTETVDADTGDLSSRSQASTTSVGTGGYVVSDEASTRTGNQVDTTSRSRGVVRGGGQVGAQVTSGTSTGQVDAEGNVVKGSATKNTAAGGVVAGPGEAGLAGRLGQERTQTRAKGVTTGQSVTLDGKVLVTCHEVEGSSPPRYRVGLTINLGGGLTVSTGAEKKAVADASSGGSAGLSVTATGSLTGTFSRLMSEEETAAYLGDVRDHTANGAYRELKVIELAAHGALEEAATLLNQLRAAQGSAQAARQLQEGQSVELKAAGTVGATGSLGGTSSGGLALGVKLGYSVSGSIARTVGREAGLIIVKLDVLKEGKGTVGGTLGMGVGSMGVTGTSGQLSGQSVTFQLDPDKDADFDAHFSAIQAADSIEKLRALAQAKPELVTTSTITTGRSSSTTTAVSIAKVGLEIEEGTSLTESVTTDRTGLTKQITGTGSAGGSLSLPVGPKITSKTTDSFTGKVGADKSASGETSTTRSETDFGRSAKALVEAPIATVTGAVTGSGSVLQQRTEAKGTKVDDADYQRLLALASSQHDWDEAFLTGGGRVNDALSDWHRTRNRILAAGGDREAAIRALAEFEAGGSGRGGAIQAAFHGAGAGIRYDFPDVLSAQKPVYDELVVGDPAGAARALAAAGKTAEAQAKLQGDLKRLTSLQQAISAQQAEVSDPAVLGEMLRRVGERATQLRATARSLSTPPPVTSAPAGPKAGTPSTAAPDPAAKAREDARVAAEERRAKMDTIIPACQAFQDREKATFALIDSEYDHWYRKADYILVINKLNELSAMYKEWDRQIADLRAVYTEMGDQPSRADQFAPNRAAWQEKYKRWKTI